MANLSAIKVEKLNEPGKYSDGDGLFLVISQSGRKRWEFRYQLNKVRRTQGLGAYDKKSNTLADARKKANDSRLLILDGVDPIDHAKLAGEKRQELNSALEVERERAEELNQATFIRCANEYIEKKSAEWKNAKHKQQWQNTLETYVYPHIGSLPVKDIAVYDVRKCLDPIWLSKTETASRVRQRIEVVISSAIANGWRDPATGNPAMWKGLLENFYPRPEKVKKKRYIEEGTDGHFKAMPYDELPAFMAELVKLNGFAPLALRFLILTAPRTTELRLAEWPEIDFDKKIWTVPEGRMKAGKRHRIALSDAAIELLENVPRLSDSNYIFPGWKRGKPMSENGLSSVLKKMKITHATVHGFRSSFRDYIGEETGYPDRLAEYALAHQLTDEAERAYARGDKLKKRFDMMNTWSAYCDSKLQKGSVTPFARRQKVVNK